MEEVSVVRSHKGDQLREDEEEMLAWGGRWAKRRTAGLQMYEALRTLCDRIHSAVTRALQEPTDGARQPSREAIAPEARAPSGGQSAPDLVQHAPPRVHGPEHRRLLSRPSSESESFV